jgi:aromatic ring-opening dioxygenase LigB subunit
MPLIKVAFLPHSPLLIPEIGRANHAFLTKTTEAYQEIGQEIKALAVDTIIIISPHGSTKTGAFTINVAPEMSISFQDFGFIPTKTVVSGDALLADQIKNAMKPEYTVAIRSEENLDYGSAIPAYLLKLAMAENFKAIIISPAEDLSLEEQYKFGAKLKEIIKSQSKKIAVIASGDLSHRLQKKSPGGYSPKGAKFDNKLIEYLNEPETAAKNILNIDNKIIEAAGECGLKPLLIALGVLDGENWQPEVLAYQTDFGVGYLSFDFKLN